VLETIRSWQLPGGGFPGWMFETGRPGYTHTVAYVLRGFLESARILRDDGESFEAPFRLQLTNGDRHIVKDAKAGAFRDERMVCATGERPAPSRADRLLSGRHCPAHGRERASHKFGGPWKSDPPNGCVRESTV